MGAYTLFDKPADVERFKAFLSSRGCDVLAPTNPYELIRFKAAGRTNVAYTNSKGRLSIVGPDLGPAAASFANGQAWLPAGETREARVGSGKRRAIIRRLLERDGAGCFYCAQPLHDDDRTVEHLVPIAHGGTNRIGNMALCHAACNLEAGHLSVFEKIRLRESKRPAADLVAALENILDYTGGADTALNDDYVVDRARAAIAKARA